MVETIRNYGYLGKKQSELTPFEEVIKFAEENGRIPNKIKKELSERTEKEKEENSLYSKWIGTEERKIVERDHLSREILFGRYSNLRKSK